MPPSNRTDKRRNPTGRFLASKTKSKGGSHGYGHGQMPANRTRDPYRHQDRSREFWAQPSVFRAHPLPDLSRESRLVRTGSLGPRAERRGAWHRGLIGLIIPQVVDDRDGDAMAHIQISTETIYDSAQRMRRLAHGLLELVRLRDKVQRAEERQQARGKFGPRDRRKRVPHALKIRYPSSGPIVVNKRPRVDPFTARQINHLARRSASGPQAD